MKMKTEKGKIKRHFSDKGYGFIEYGGGKEIFFHITDVEKRDIQEGDEVEFVIGTGKNGRPAAKKVKKAGNGFLPGFLLPKDTKENLNYQATDDLSDNFSLSLNKYIKFTLDKNGKIEAKIKEQKLEQELTKIGNIPVKAIHEKQAASLQLLQRAGYSICSINNLHTNWRLVVGLGSGSIYETSLTLHHTYGIPYIPGSALKGITRSYYLTRVLWPQFPEESVNALDRLLEYGYNYIQALRKDENWYKNLEKKLTVNEPGNLKKPGDKLLSTNPDEITGFQEASFIFGNQRQQGWVYFMDAFPLSSLRIKEDVMNPHFSDYYLHGKPPVDYLAPKPINFLVVEKASFAFYLLSLAKDKTLLPVASNWLRSALMTRGVGAKTAVGYGYFNSIS